MDEILIEEKKYVSSKQAAKITGYAKDYIGQLCREGRVPARLVGRSWYVLETAIYDHRFGEQKIEQEAVKITSKKVGSTSVFPSTWESPRYEASSAEVLPSVNRILYEDSSSGANDNDEISKRLQDSWKAWFNRVEDTSSIISKDTSEIEDKNKLEKSELETADKVINVPIRAIHQQRYQPPPEELLPRHLVVEPINNVHVRRGNRAGLVNATQITGAILATIMAILAVIGSGYFDKYIISSSQVRIITGVVIYNK